MILRASWLGLVAGLLPGFAVAQEGPSLALALGQLQYSARETGSSGATLNRETGALPTVEVQGAWRSQAWFAEGAHLLARHDVVYQGYTQIGIPLETTTRIALNKSALRLGRMWQIDRSSKTSLSLGLEHLQIDRQILPALGSLPLRETLGIYQAALGARWTHEASALAGLSLDADLSALWALQSRLAVDSYGLYDRIRLQPSRGTDWRASLSGRYRWRNHASLSVTLVHETVNPGASSQEVWTREGVAAASVRYPGSRQTMDRVQIGLGWLF